MDMKQFSSHAIEYFFIAFGVLIGGALLSGVGAFLVNKPPLVNMSEWAQRLNIWAVVAAMGGSMDTLENLERGILSGIPVEVVKQVLLLIAAMLGAHTATIVVHWLTQEQ